MCCVVCVMLMFDDVFDDVEKKDILFIFLFVFGGVYVVKWEI